MITTTTLLGFAVLAMRKSTETISNAWKPSMKEADELEKAMASFAAKEVNGKKQYPYELYLESKGYISFDQFGRWQVINPIMFARMNDTQAFLEWRQGKDQEKMFQAFPEEKIAHRERVDKLIKSLKVA